MILYFCTICFTKHVLEIKANVFSNKNRVPYEDIVIMLKKGTISWVYSCAK